MRTLISILMTAILTISVNADYAIKGATVLTMDDGKVLENATVLVIGDRITAVTPGMGIPEALEVIDGRGKYLIPGLAEMHGHLPFGSWAEQQIKDTLFLYLAGGVTTVRGMLGDSIQFDLREKITSGEMDGPTLYLAAPSLNGNTVRSPEQGRELVRKYTAEGWDLLKIHPGIRRKDYLALTDEARTLGIPFGGHVPQDVGIITALEAGQISLEHMDGYMAWLKAGDGPLSAQDIQRGVDLTLRHKAWIVPTQVLFGLLRSGGDLEALKARPENKYVSAQTLKNWEAAVKRINIGANDHIAPNRDRMLKALSDAGALIALGSDAPQIFSVPGFSVWREMKAMVTAGMSVEQVLRSGTIAPGQYFADKDRFGRIKPGHRADLILLEADPRLDVDNITKQAGVMAAGRWYSRSDIDRRLDDIARRNAQP